MILLRHRMRTPHSLRLLSALLALALVLAACNGGDDSDGNGGSSSEDATGSVARGEDDPEESPTPKTEDELDEIEEEEPFEKVACAATSKLKAKKGRASIELETTDNAFAPQCPVGASLNNLIEFTITNNGERAHNFSAPARGIDVDVQPGESQVVQMAMGNDKIPFFCKFHADQGMRGAIFPGKPPKAKGPKNQGGGSGENGGGGDDGPGDDGGTD